MQQIQLPCRGASGRRQQLAWHAASAAHGGYHLRFHSPYTRPDTCCCSTSTYTQQEAPPDYDQLAALAGASRLVDVGTTALGRGLVASHVIKPRKPVVSVPVESALLITDEPLSSISRFGEEHLRRFGKVSVYIRGRLAWWQAEIRYQNLA